MWFCTTPGATAQHRAVLDPSFHGGSVVTDVAGGADAGYALALESDGSFWVTGRAFEGQGGANLVLIRYRPDGRLDPGTGNGGIVTLDRGNAEYGQSVIVQSDGRVVVAGVVEGQQGHLHDMLVARFRRDGTPDPTFGDRGAVVLDLGGIDMAHAVFEQTIGSHSRLIVVGTRNEEIALVRLRADGRRDDTFGQNGLVTTDVAYRGHVGRTVVQQPDGRIVVVGAAGRRENGAFDLVLVRYHADGRLDRSFGQRGIVTTAVSGRVDVAQSAVVEPGGRIVVAATVSDSTSERYRTVALRYLPDGRIDPGFGSRGIARIPGTGSQVARGIARASDGSFYLVVGRHVTERQRSGQNHSSSDPSDAPGLQQHELSIVRVTPDGRLDPAFKSATLRMQSASGWRGTRAVAARGRGLVVVGSSMERIGHDAYRAPDVRVVRFVILDRNWTILPTGLYVPVYLNDDGAAARTVSAVDFGK